MTRFALTCAAVLLAGTAIAAPITGQIDFVGTYEPNNRDLTQATTIFFNGVDNSGAPLFQRVAAVSGDLDTFIKVDDPARFADLQFSPFSPIRPLWIVDGFQFNLESVSRSFSDSQTLILTGRGLLTGIGFDATTYNFVWSGQTADGTPFSFSLSQAARPTPVPVPATLALLGAGLTAVALRRRRA